MKQQRPYPAYTVSRKAQAALEGGHPWVYADEIRAAPDTRPENGALVDLVSDKGRYLGTGMLSEQSKIRVRLLSTNANDRFDEAFWRRRLQWAWDYRKQVMAEEELSCCRIVFGEADFLPGLTVDRFGPYLVTQTLSVGIERRKAMLFPLLVEILRADGQQIAGIYERNDVALRAKEGLAEGKGFFALPGEPVPDETTAEIVENGIRYLVDFENGQKTGFFLDQKANRRAAGGAAHVTAVDVSESAVALARENARRNGLEDRMDFIAADVFDLLPRLAAEGGTPYDFIILDPPAFTKSRRTVEAAMRGYKEINYRAMKLLPRGGYLASCSCSHFASEPLFIKMLHAAAHDAGVRLRQIEARQQAPDHPILWGVEETNYLKFFLFQVV